MSDFLEAHSILDHPCLYDHISWQIKLFTVDFSNLDLVTYGNCYRRLEPFSVRKVITYLKFIRHKTFIVCIPSSISISNEGKIPTFTSYYPLTHVYICLWRFLNSFPPLKQFPYATFLGVMIFLSSRINSDSVFHFLNLFFHFKIKEEFCGSTT